MPEDFQFDQHLSRIEIKILFSIAGRPAKPWARLGVPTAIVGPTL
jgi:hypothetical protein